MKIKTLSRSTAQAQAPGTNVARQPRNLAPENHPFERAREYHRALNATKLSRMFAKPFLGQLGDGHVDGVYKIAKDPNTIEHLASGSGDGVVKVWDLSARKEAWQAKSHDNMVKGLCWMSNKKLLSCGGVDRTIVVHDPFASTSDNVPLVTIHGKHMFTSLSCHQNMQSFAASNSAGISIYDLTIAGSRPSLNLLWPTSVDTVSTVAFNQVETSMLASSSTDRSIILYDVRTASPISKTILTLATNAISWNPMEAFNFATANEDHNIYIFDTRNMSRALNVLKDHVSAVMDVAFSPTGEDLASASYDRTIRLWSRSGGHSRDIYHTKRMQRVFCTTFTSDNKFVLSGSDDGNIRLWRTHASSRSGIKSAQQRQALDYQEALKHRYAHMPEIKRIARHRHIPRTVKKAGEIKREELASSKRKEGNRRKHEMKTVGKAPRKSERERMLLRTEG